MNNMGVKVSQTGGHSPDPIDYDLHGLAGIRLLNASPGEAAIVARQLGPIQAPLTREPDIVIRFVDQLSTPSRVRYIGLDDAAFTDDAFLVLRSQYKSRARVQIAFDQIGRQCEIVCERGLPAVPLLIPILNLTVLGNGALPFHASAFTYNGVGVLVTGWSKGGKTETLLAFMARGARYVGDEWVYLHADGQRMHGIPEPIRLWDWQLEQMPEYRAQVKRNDRARMRALKLLIRSLEGGMSLSLGRKLLPASVMSRLLPLLKRQLNVQVRPQKLFGDSACALTGSLHKLVFVASHEAADITTAPMDAGEIAHRMVFSLQHERLDLLAYYLKFRFAFPGRANDLIEQAEARQRELLTRMLAGKEAYAVHHPYPVAIASLFDTISPLLKEAPRPLASIARFPEAACLR